MKSAIRIFSFVLALLTVAGLFVGCKKKNDTLVVGYYPFSSKFSPFFAETAYDQDAYVMTQLGLLTSDRTGAIILKGIKGETKAYNGTDYTYYGPADLTITEDKDTGKVYYDFKLREDLKFSDGEKLTIDDVIFSMYVLCDPTYEGNSTLYALPIEGIKEYRAGIESRGDLIFKAGKDGYTATDYFTEEQYNKFWDYYNNNSGVDFAQSIVDYCKANNYNASTDSVAACAANWGYELDENATAADFWKAIVDNFEGDEKKAEETESAGSSRKDLTIAALGNEFRAGVQTGESAANIAGIQKTGDYSMRVTLTEIDAAAIYQLGIYIAPLHYYGAKEKYDYDNNKFGFDKGDLTPVRAKTTQPMGAGPYKFIKFEKGVINYEANKNYYLGAPKTKYVNFQECLSDDDKLNGVTTGTIDITDPSMKKTTAESISKTNGNKGLVGDKITTDLVSNLGYGYIGMNSIVMSVDNQPGSEASKNLRRAFGTIFSVYRDLAIDSYYGELASVINYPISDTSWAAPRASDDGYKFAFSTDVNGNDIYTSDMKAEDKYEAAKKAALGFLEAAGYTVTDGKVTAAPNGAKLEYEAWIPADGSGDHPSFMIYTESKKALADIGINLIIKDLTNSTELWTAIEAHQVALWAAAWGATVDPDMYQIYYSDVANHTEDLGNKKNPIGGPGQGGSNYMYCIADAELDKLILDARSSTDQTYRKSMYKACLDKVIDWAVEIPVYQRQNAVIFSTERVNMDTVTPDITTFYGWLSEIEKVELK